MSKQDMKFVWSKADKPHPTKYNKPKAANPFSITAQQNSQKMNESFCSDSNGTSDGTSDDYSNEPDSCANRQTTSQISMKDLCNEDKQRIANLIKELARIGDEKTKLEQSLANERKQKDKEIKDALLLQEALLVEKEKLLNKFAKTQEKLEHLKRSQKQSAKKPAKEQAIEPSPNIELPPRPVKANQEAKSELAKAANVPEAKRPIGDPHTSSTPRDLSPVVATPAQETTKSTHEDDVKRIELLKQRMELLAEQKSLNELMERQEQMLKEKQEQILLQQRLHRERLEQLQKTEHPIVPAIAFHETPSSTSQHTEPINTVPHHPDIGNLVTAITHLCHHPSYTSPIQQPLPFDNNQNHLANPLNPQPSIDPRSPETNFHMPPNSSTNPQYTPMPVNYHRQHQMMAPTPVPEMVSQFCSIPNYNTSCFFNQSSQPFGPTDLNQMSQQTMSIPAPSSSFNIQYVESNHELYNYPSQVQLQPMRGIPAVNQAYYNQSPKQFQSQFLENHSQFDYQPQMPQTSVQMKRNAANQNVVSNVEKLRSWNLQQTTATVALPRREQHVVKQGNGVEMNVNQKNEAFMQQGGSRGFGMVQHMEDIEESKLIEDLFFIK